MQKESGSSSWGDPAQAVFIAPSPPPWWRQLWNRRPRPILKYVRKGIPRGWREVGYVDEAGPPTVEHLAHMAAYGRFDGDRVVLDLRASIPDADVTVRLGEVDADNLSDAAGIIAALLESAALDLRQLERPEPYNRG